MISTQNNAQRLFIITALVFGLLYIFIVPPFQVPDEGHHLYRAYHIATGHVYGHRTIDYRFGGEMPSNLVELEHGFRYLRYDYDARIDNNTWLTAAIIPLQPEKTSFADFPNVAYYVPLPYLVQAIALRLGIVMELPPLFLLYVSRLAGFFFWVTLLYLAVRLIPFHKHTFAVIALLPSSLFINSGMTADSFTYGLCYLLFAFIMKLAYGKQEKTENSSLVSHKSWVLVLLMALSVTLSKVIYCPLLLLLLLIPANKFAHPWTKVRFIGSLFLINLLALFIMFHLMKDSFISYENYHPDYRENVQLNEGVHPTQQLDFVIDNPGQFTKIALRSHIAYLPASVVHCVGKFGWEKNYLPFWIVGLLIIVLLAGGAMEQTPKNSVVTTPSSRLVFLAVIFSIVAVFTIVIYMQWSPVGNDTILSLGGRYYLPLLPLFFLVLKTDLLQVNQKLLRRMLWLCIWVGLTVGVYSVIGRYWMV